VRFQALGLSKLANELINKVKGHEGKERDHYALVAEKEEEYMPKEGCDDDLLSMGKGHAVDKVFL